MNPKKHRAVEEKWIHKKQRIKEEAKKKYMNIKYIKRESIFSYYITKLRVSQS